LDLKLLKVIFADFGGIVNLHQKLDLKLLKVIFADFGGIVNLHPKFHF
jgi:hypothetical protein